MRPRPRPGSAKPTARRGPPDAARLVAYQLLRAVTDDSAYANLLLPKLIDEHRLDGRDAALATELGYGTLRASGVLDVVLSHCVDRPLAELDPPVLDLLRLGAYQGLRTRIPAHATVATTVDLAHATGNGRAGGLLNAVLRKVVVDDWDGWVDRLAVGRPPLDAIALRTAHPRWIAAAFADALGESADDFTPAAELTETDAALVADEQRPRTHLVAWPGVLDRDQLIIDSGGEPGPWSPYAVRLTGGDPGQLADIRVGRAAVQDEGSQLCAIALAAAPLDGPDARWLDLCAGPGGKAALLAALADERGAHLTANELHPHRAELVAKATARWSVDVQVGDARELTGGDYDRVLLDAPCTGLGALRRRPEVRWRRQPDDVAALAELQRELLDAALRLVRPGGLVAYVTCSPLLTETLDIVGSRPELVDARGCFAGIPDLGPGPTIQLWPHRHGTDAMFFALLRRPPADPS